VTSALSIPATPSGPATPLAGPDRSLTASWPETPPGADPLPGQLDRWLAARGAELVAVRRHIHAHPELSGQEFETAAMVARELAVAGLSPRFLPKGNGVICDIGVGDRVVALRADLDALPLPDTKDVPYRSTVDNVCHACGHDVHTTVLLGAGLALAQLAQRDELPGRVRLLFQPAEEVMPGGALELISTGALDDVRHVFGLHCDPGLDVGRVGLREGPLTGAADSLSVRLTGRGGHTSRPHLTEDLTYALAKVVTDVPAALSRRLDPRAGAALVWGSLHAGGAQNVIPSTGTVSGTLRMLDADAWASMGHLVEDLVEAVVAPYGVSAKVEHVRGVPPVVNDRVSVEVVRGAARAVLGPDAVESTRQSLGGEDFAWYLTTVPGAMIRLGTRTPGGRTYDLHQGDLTVDENAICAGAKLLAVSALACSSLARPIGA
jgi:amidohydrolase